MKTLICVRMRRIMAPLINIISEELIKLIEEQSKVNRIH